MKKLSEAQRALLFDFYSGRTYCASYYPPITILKRLKLVTEDPQKPDHYTLTESGIEELKNWKPQ